MIALGAFELTPERSIRVCRWLFDMLLAKRPEAINESAVRRLERDYLAGIPDPNDEDSPV